MTRPRTSISLMPVRHADFLAVKKLLRELWLITDDLAQYQIRSYREHIRECHKAKNDASIACEKVVEILRLCEEVNGSIFLSLTEVYEKVRDRGTHGPAHQQIHDRSVQQAIGFAVRLCHFIPLDSELRKGTSSIAQLLQGSLGSCTSRGPDRTLKDDFNEKNLARRADIRFRYTSNLTRHLELQGNNLFVFRHGAVLNAYENNNQIRDIYPPGFLLETQATIDLLFPVSENRLGRRKRRLSAKNLVDLEVGDLGTQTGEPDRRLHMYQYWGRRLAIIEDKYQSSKPGRLKQWYYDRRDATSFTMFWFTLLAFVLAVIFGLIASVTAIMQTWKAYHP